jgi:hypothetical protein
VTLALERHTETRIAEEGSPAADALDTIDTCAHVAEGVAVAGYLYAAGTLAEPLTKGKWAPCFWGAVAGVAAAEVLKRLPLGRAGRRRSRMASALVGVAGGFAPKWAMLHAGRDSASDPEAERQVSRPRIEAS